MIFLALYSCLLLVYSFVLLKLRIAWNSIENVLITNDEETEFSIIIPFRNEKSNLVSLIYSLEKSNYKNTKFEILFVNDNSEDGGELIVEKYLQKHNNFLLLNSEGEGKKAALTQAIGYAKNDYIITIDADCIVPENLMFAYNQKILEGNYDLISGPVQFVEKSYLHKFLNFELIGLVGIGASTMKQGNATMANGANLCFKKEVFLLVEGYTGNNNIASGDDEFLLSKVANLPNAKVSFLKSDQGIVLTKAAEFFSEFVQQRKRWSSKWKLKTFKDSLSPIFLFLLYVTFLTSFFNTEFLKINILLLFFKIIVELAFMIPILKFYKRTDLFYIVILIQLFYPFYIIYIGLLSLFSSEYQWKNRKVK